MTEQHGKERFRFNRIGPIGVRLAHGYALSDSLADARLNRALCKALGRGPTDEGKGAAWDAAMGAQAGEI